ncbi:TPA: hypothetical protein ENG04_04670 [Candidatus Poribacteria bacterium]|nr:hypothetical protein [Candidatus Poribacteria bacterium]HEX29355.1 hypothetical protein [Candidatus Poribacteria bacterium]
MRNDLLKLIKAKFPSARNATPLEIELMVRGFEGKLKELYSQFQNGDCSFGYMAEQLGLNTWELEELLERRNLKVRNL